MRVLALIKMSSPYCERMDDSLVITCSVDERLLYTASPPSPFNRLFLADIDACENIIPTFRENRFPTAWAIWNRDANFDGWMPFVDDLRQRQNYRNIFKDYDYIVKIDDDVIIKTKDWDRILSGTMNNIGPDMVSLGAAAFTSSKLAIVNHSKFVMYRSDYILRDGPIKLEPTYMHPNVTCEVLQPKSSVVDRLPIGRSIEGGKTNVVA